MGLLDKMVKAVLGSTTSDAGALTASQVNLLRQAMEPLGTLSAPRVAERALAFITEGTEEGVLQDLASVTPSEVSSNLLGQPGRLRHLHVEYRIAHHRGPGGGNAGFRQRAFQHRRMRFRRVAVGRLPGHEIFCQPMRGQNRHQPARRLGKAALQSFQPGQGLEVAALCGVCPG